MSNSNTNMQTQSSNALHNAIMEASSKDRPPMLAPVPVAEGSFEITTERYMENYKNVSQDIRDQINAEAEAVQIILIGIDNDIYSTVDACPNACEMWKAIERLKQDTYFVEYTGLEVQHFRDTLLQHLGNVKKSVAERTRHQRQYERRVNKRQMQTQESKIDTGKALDADLVDTESIRTDSTVQDDSSRSGNDTDADDADIRPIYDEEPMAEVQLTAECNIFAIGQQHTEQPEIIVEGRVDQYPETCQVKSHMLDSSPDNQTTEYSKQSLESENILLKETVA
ncbi:hypothetical protein Tco_0370100 [Tanacetum coccineum]